MPEEKRTYDRYPLLATACLHCHNDDNDSENKEIIAFVANISQTGLGLYSTESIGLDKSLTIEIAFTDVMGEEIVNSVKGKVTWESKRDTHYFTGVALSNELLFVQL